MKSPDKVLTSPFTKTQLRRYLAPVTILVALLSASLASADDSKLSGEQRQQIIRAFLAEQPFVHRALPRGKAGVKIEGSKITPSEGELSQLVNQFGPAAKPGERAKITAVRFVHDGILFEINGGPVKKKKWSDHVSVGGMGGLDPSRNGSQAAAENINASGSSVFLSVKEKTATLTPDQIKDQLAPFLDFKAATVAEAYQKSLPPKLAAAVKSHHPLVGMDKEMVTYAMGRPPRRIREDKDGQDYEEWIYGAPPQDVEFIRFVGEKAVRIEEMKVTGEKVVREQDEIGDLNGTLDASTQRKPRPDSAAANAADDRRGAPTLLRPDETKPDPDDGPRDNNPQPPQDSPVPPSGPK
jgi:hypothetical protein